MKWLRKLSLPLTVLIAIIMIMMIPILQFVVIHGWGYYVTVNGTYTVPNFADADIVSGHFCKVVGVELPTHYIVCKNISGIISQGDEIYGNGTLYIHVSTDYILGVVAVGIGMSVLMLLGLITLEDKDEGS